MSLNLGSTSIDSLYLGSTKIGEAYLGSTKVYASVDPYNPLNLPAYTIRCKFDEGYTPPQPIRTQVSASPNVWDITYVDTDWEEMLGYDSALLEVLGANTTGVTNMTGMFRLCRNLVTVPLFDTSSVTNMSNMFRDCSSLTNVPLFDTESATDMSYMFRNCTAVQSGALALYQQASSQSTPPLTYTDCFKDCGMDTQTGAAELAQIPASWGGTYDPYNPLGLPAYTIRCKFSSGYTPNMGDSQTLVDATDNVWDITKNSTDWSGIFRSNLSLLEVLGANATGVTNMVNTFSGCTGLVSIPLFDTGSVTYMSSMFGSCTSLTSVPLFDTSSATHMHLMLNGCTSLTSIPLFDTSSAQGVISAFSGCTAVESGALALYQQMSTQSTPPTSYTSCFRNCGSGTVTGAAELAQIPASWGGTGA